MSAQTDIYDFERVMESALKAIFTANQITAYTTQDLIPTNDDGTPVVDFQLRRPCVTITFQPGQAAGQWFPLQIGSDWPKQPANTSWAGQFQLEVITEAQIKVHSEYRALARWIMNTMGARVNGTAPMTKHRIQPAFLDGGTTVAAKTDEGYLLTRMQYNINFSVQSDAWATLATS